MGPTVSEEREETHIHVKWYWHKHKNNMHIILCIAHLGQEIAWDNL